MTRQASAKYYKKTTKKDSRKSHERYQNLIEEEENNKRVLKTKEKLNVLIGQSFVYFFLSYLWSDTQDDIIWQRQCYYCFFCILITHYSSDFS